MDITAFIRELLFGHDCVIVPGFGGFIGNYTPASIDKSSGTFYPPVKQISFNRNLNHNDGLLDREDFRHLQKSIMVMPEIWLRNLLRNSAENLKKEKRLFLIILEVLLITRKEIFSLNLTEMQIIILILTDLNHFSVLPLEGYDVRKRIIRHVEKDPVRQASMRKILWRAAVIVPLLSVLVAVPLENRSF